jgi:hypothetical protein
MISTFIAEKTDTNFVNIKFFYDNFLVCEFEGYTDSFELIENTKAEEFVFKSFPSRLSGRTSIQLCEVCYFTLVAWLCDNTQYPLVNKAP